MHGFLGTHESVPKRHFDRVQQILQASLYSQETDKQKHTENTLRYDDARIPCCACDAEQKKSSANDVEQRWSTSSYHVNNGCRSNHLQGVALPAANLYQS